MYHRRLMSRTKRRNEEEEDREKAVVIQPRAYDPPAFGEASAKITRQELSPKVLLIANKSDLVPQ